MTKYNYYFNGPYGVVDLFRRNIWINLQDEKIAHAVRKTFASKVGLVVYDLSIFENYSNDPPLVDIDCCLDWQIGVEDRESVSNVSLSSIDLSITQRKNSSPVLINNTVTTLLTSERNKELQEQMSLYVQILQGTKLHLPIDPEIVEENYIKLQFDPAVNYNEKFFDIYQKVNTIFSRDLHTTTIETELQDLANNFIINEYPAAAFMILKLLNKLYD
jgi:hypothetical protein